MKMIKVQAIMLYQNGQTKDLSRKNGESKSDVLIMIDHIESLRREILIGGVVCKIGLTSGAVFAVEGDVTGVLRKIEEAQK